MALESDEEQPQRDKRSETWSLYARNYMAARELSVEGRFREGLQDAMRTLIEDPAMPRYWQIYNCVLIAYGSSDWYEAERFRLLAEEILSSVLKDGNAISDGEFCDNEGLADLRRTLDELAEEQEEQGWNVEGSDGTEEPELMVENYDEEANETVCLMDEAGKLRALMDTDGDGDAGETDLRMNEVENAREKRPSQVIPAQAIHAVKQSLTRMPVRLSSTSG